MAKIYNETEDEDEFEEPKFKENILIDKFLLDSQTFVYDLSFVDKAKLSQDPQNDIIRNCIFKEFDLKSTKLFEVNY